MKKILSTHTILFLFLLLLQKNVYSQIIYEHTYPYLNNSSIKDRVQLKDIGNGDFKYIYTDYATNELKIFNIDHSPYLTISIQVPLVDEHEYVIGYVTKSLFDCDTTMIEYAIMPVNWKRTLYIERQDGTVLFSRDSTVATYCFGCFSGSYDIRPIVNTPAGAKMFLAKCDTNGFQMTVDVYSLCGTLPMNADPIIDNAGEVTVYPNPVFRSQINFQWNTNLIMPDSELEIYNATGQLIHTVKLNINSDRFVLDANGYASGNYYYRLISNNKVMQSGKFIIN